MNDYKDEGDAPSLDETAIKVAKQRAPKLADSEVVAAVRAHAATSKAAAWAKLGNMTDAQVLEAIGKVRTGTGAVGAMWKLLRDTPPKVRAPKAAVAESEANETAAA